jgi:AbrB family looped-hinge helix DNA binding protein
MVDIATITSKGQVTIPVSIRKSLGLSKNDRVVFLKKDKIVELRPVVDFLSLEGSVKSRKKYTDKKADKAVGKFIAKQYGKENKTG